jgi:P4 family phage/plasmid primase-like protien
MSSQSEIITFAIENDLKFIGSHISLDENGNKKFTLTKGWKDKSAQQLATDFDNKYYDYNWSNVFIVPSYEYLVIDTDGKDSYDWFEEYIYQNELTPTKTRTFRNSKEHPYKYHYWFKVNKDDFIDRIKDGTEQFEEFKLDILYGDKCQVLEFISSSFKEPDILTYREFKEIYKIIKSKCTKKITNIQPTTEQKKECKIDNTILNTILDNLNPDRFINYTYWINIYMIFKNEELDLDLFNYYSKKHYKKYNEEKNNKILNSIKSINKGLTIATLYFWLKKDNIEIFRSLQPKRDDFWKLMNNSNHNDYSKIFYQLEKNKYVVSSKTGWYVYNMHNVLENTGDKYPPSLLNNISDQLQQYIEEQKQYVKLDDEKFTEKMKKLKKEYDSVGMGTYAEGIIKYLRTHYTIDNIDDLIDANQKLFSFDDKLYDVDKNDFRNIKPSDYIKTTNKLLCNEKSNKGIRTNITNLLKSIFEKKDIIDYWMTITGLSLFTNKFEKFFILTGVGGNGKGLLSTIIEKALGNYYYQAQSSFLSTKYEADKPSPTLARCQGVRYLSISEPESDANSPLKVDFIKSITGGDPITCRALHKNNTTYKPQFTPFLQCNEMPKLNKIDGGITRRLEVIDYPFKFVENPTKPEERKINYALKDEITPDFINEFLLMLFEYASKNINNKTIDKPNDVINSSGQYLDNNNPVKDFITRYLIKTDKETDKIKCSKLLEYFHRADPSLKDIDNKKFISLLKYNEINLISYANAYSIKGYKYVQPKEEDEEQPKITFID